MVLAAAGPYWIVTSGLLKQDLVGEVASGAAPDSLCRQLRDVGHADLEKDRAATKTFMVNSGFATRHAELATQRR